MALQIRRGPTVDREGITPLVGELIYDTDSKGLFIGDGVTPGGTGVSGYTNEEIQDLAAVLFTSGVHTGGITFVYNDSQNRIDVAVATQLEADLAPTLGGNLDLNSKDITGTGNINITGSITANYIDAKGNISGSVYSDGSTLLIDGTEGTIVLDGTIAGHVVPKADITYDLGSSEYRFRDLYLSGSSIKLGDATITSTSTRVDLPAGSTVGGLSIVTGILGNSIVANVTGDVKGSVFGDDSTVIIDGTSNSVFASSVETNRLSISTNTITATSDITINLASVNDNTVTVSGITDGTFGSQLSSIIISGSKGTLEEPANTGAGDYVGRITFNGYYGGGTKTLSTILTGWDASAVMTDPYPASNVVIVSNKGASSNYLTFNYQGVLNAPIFKATGYATGSLPSATGSAEEGYIVFDTTTKQFKGWNGSAWVVLG